MTRQAIRDMKRAIASNGRMADDESPCIAREAATNLLERSVSFGHERLALIRLVIATDVGAEVSALCWAYCEEIAKASADITLQAMFQRARQGSACAVHREKYE